MKRFLFICLLIVSASYLYPQDVHTRFPFGFYSYYNGLKWADEKDPCSAARDYSLPLMWNKSFFTNTYVFDANNCHSNCSWVQMAYLYSSDRNFYNSGVLLPPVLRTYSFLNYIDNNQHFWKMYPEGYKMFPGIVAMSESNYFTFKGAAGQSGDGFILDELPKGVTASSAGKDEKVNISVSGYTKEFRLIKDVRINSAPPSNTSFLKPGVFNIRKSSAGDHGVAEFFLKVKADFSSPLPKGSYIRFRLLNKYRGSADRDNDVIDTDEQGKQLKIMLDNSGTEYDIPFTMKAMRAGGGKVFSAWTFGFGLEAYIYIAPGSSRAPVKFSLESITVYDKLGYEVMDHLITKKPAGFSYPDYNKMLTAGYGAFSAPIIHLADEAFIANFLPMKTVILDIQRMQPEFYRRAYFYITQPDPGKPEQCRRLLSEIFERKPSIPGIENKIHLGIDFYNFHMNEKSDADFENNIKEFSSLYREFYSLGSRYKLKSLISVPQAFGFNESQRGGASWRLPDYNEMCAQSYIALMSGYKGIIYYEAAFNMEENNVYRQPEREQERGQFLYAPPASDPGSGRSNLHPVISGAVRMIGEFLSRKTGIKEHPAQGDIFMDLDFNRYVIAGTDNTYIKDIAGAASDRPHIYRIELLTGNGNNPSPSDRAFAGIAAADEKNNGNIHYVFIANLYSKDVRTRLYLSGGKGKAEVTDISGGKIKNKVLGPNDRFEISLKASEALILRVENK